MFDMTEQRSYHPSYPRRWRILGFLLLVELMDLLDGSVVNTAIPSIREHLGSGTSAVQWIVGGYALTYAIGLVTGGRLGDIYGRRQVIQVGLVGFVASSVVCGIAPSTEVLIGGRLVQGVFAAIMIPQAFGILKDVFPDDEIGQVFAIFGPVIGLGAILGPIVGGGLVDLNLFDSGWRSVFLVNVPLGAIALIGAARVLPESRLPHAPRLDVLGMTFVMAGATLLIYPLIQGREQGWPAWMFVAMAASLVALAAFWRYEVARERRGADPLIEPSIFRKRAFSSGLLVVMTFFAGMVGMLLVFTVFLQAGEGFSPLHAGATLGPMMLGMGVGAGLSGGLLGPKYGRLVVQAGAVVMIAGLVALIAVVDTGVTTWQLLGPELLLGLGQGLMIAPVFEIALAGVDPREVGSASGVLNAVQQLGAAIGVAVVGTVFFSVLESHGFVVALQRTLWLDVGLMVLVLALTPMLPRKAREHEVLAAADVSPQPA
jgi:EmrB/QacA subfamily drug resistance transporter